MKTKSFAMLAVSSLLTAAFVYVAPAMADDTTSGMPMEQMLADNSSTGSAMQMPADTNTGNAGTPATTENTDNSASPTTQDQPTATPSGDSANNNANGDANSGSNSGASTTDQGTPDTATGDDDY